MATPEQHQDVIDDALDALAADPAVDDDTYRSILIDTSARCLAAARNTRPPRKVS